MGQESFSGCGMRLTRDPSACQTMDSGLAAVVTDGRVGSLLECLVTESPADPSLEHANSVTTIDAQGRDEFLDNEVSRTSASRGRRGRVTAILVFVLESQFAHPKLLMEG